MTIWALCLSGTFSSAFIREFLDLCTWTIFPWGVFILAFNCHIVSSDRAFSFIFSGNVLEYWLMKHKSGAVFRQLSFPFRHILKVCWKWRMPAALVGSLTNTLTGVIKLILLLCLSISLPPRSLPFISVCFFFVFSVFFLFHYQSQYTYTHTVINITCSHIDITLISTFHAVSDVIFLFY